MEILLDKNHLETVAEIELRYKTKVKASQRPKIKTSEDAAAIFRAIWAEDRIEFIEEFKILLLNRSNAVLGFVNISMGGVAGTVADPKLIMAAALKANASGIIISHNHPSGSLRASKADEDLTQKIKLAANFMDIKLLDHLILTKEEYYSFADNGLI